MVNKLIQRNYIQCNVCGDRLISIARHHYNSCSCVEINDSTGCSIDGGDDYMRISGSHETYKHGMGFFQVDFATWGYEYVADKLSPEPGDIYQLKVESDLDLYLFGSLVDSNDQYLLINAATGQAAALHNYIDICELITENYILYNRRGVK